ncbi:MAG: hypothetical protein ACLFNV_07345 [Desulfovibrionales bacterium]
MNYRIFCTACVLLLAVIVPVWAGPLDRHAEPRHNPAADSMLRVPGVVGYDLHSGLAVLQHSGLTPHVKTVRSVKKEYKGREGTIVEQKPSAGGVAMLGSSVTIVHYDPNAPEPSADRVAQPSRGSPPLPQDSSGTGSGAGTSGSSWGSASGSAGGWTGPTQIPVPAGTAPSTSSPVPGEVAAPSLPEPVEEIGPSQIDPPSTTPTGRIVPAGNDGSPNSAPVIDPLRPGDEADVNIPSFSEQETVSEKAGQATGRPGKSVDGSEPRQNPRPGTVQTHQSSPASISGAVSVHSGGTPGGAGSASGDKSAGGADSTGTGGKQIDSKSERPVPDSGKAGTSTTFAPDTGSTATQTPSSGGSNPGRKGKGAAGHTAASNSGTSTTESAQSKP